MKHQLARTPLFARILATLSFSIAQSFYSFAWPGAVFGADVSVVHLNVSDTKSGETQPLQSSEVTVTDIDFDPVLPDSASSLSPTQQIDEKLKIFDAKRRDLDEKARLNYLSRLKQDKVRYEIERQRLKLRDERVALDERRAALDERRVALDKERWDLDSQNRKIESELLPLDKQRTELDEQNRKLDESRVALELARAKLEQRQRALTEKK